LSHIANERIGTAQELSKLKIISICPLCPEQDIKDLLRAAGYEVTLRSVTGTLNLVESLSWKPDVILCDESLGEAGITRTIHLLCERGSTASIIVLPDNPLDAEQVLRFFRAGVRDVVNRDRLDDLVPAIQRATDFQQHSTDDQKSLDRIEQLEELWRLGQEAGKIAIWKWHNDEDRLEFSENFSPLFGLPRGELTSRGYMNLEQFTFLFHPADMNSLSTMIRDCVRLKEPFHHEVRSVYPDDSLHWILIRGDVNLDHNGRVIGIHGIAQDINERKQVQLALLDSEERFRSFMDNSKCVAFMKARSGRYVYVNQAFRESLRPSQEIIGKTDHDVYTEQIFKPIRDRDNSIWESGETWTGIEDVPIANGEVRHWWVVKFLFHNSIGEQYLGGWATDLTDRIKVEEDARVLLDELAHAARLATVGQLVSELTHELNQPLYAVGNFSSACLNVLKDIKFDHPDVLDWLTQIQSQVRRMDEIIRRSSGFTSKSKADFQLCDIKELIYECIDLVSIRYRKEPCRILYDFAPEIPLVKANALQLQQVFINLISNALESLQEIAANERELIIKAHQPTAGTVLIQVEDNGPGIPPEVMSRIFEPFFSTKTRGMGLGLPISKSIINSHGGELSVSARSPRGVMFKILLPIQAKVGEYVSS
jgi:PAS domain S-box-containing protein